MFVWWLSFGDGFFTEFSNEFGEGIRACDHACVYAWTIKKGWKQNNEMKLKEGPLKCEISWEDENFHNLMKSVLMIKNNDYH